MKGQKVHDRFVGFYASAGADPDYALSKHHPGEKGIAPARGVAVPGAVAGLLSALKRYGTLPRKTVLAPAIRLARKGFTVHTLLARVIAGHRDKLMRSPKAAAIFYPSGKPLEAGDRLVQPALAKTLERIARQGRAGFYRGKTARALVKTLSAGGNPITLGDLAHFRPKWREPLCGTYGPYTILTAPPPLGGMEVLETLNLLEPYDLKALGQPMNSPKSLGRLVGAMRIARADLARWNGDPDDAAVPAVGIASQAFANERRHWIGAPAPKKMPAGDPWQEEHSPLKRGCTTLGTFPPTTLPRPNTGNAAAATSEPRVNVVARRYPRRSNRAGEAKHAQTTHLSVVDRHGNAVSLTYTLGLYFGSGTFVGGAFYNTAAWNFGGPLANHRGPYRTPRSSTAPTIVLADGKVKLVVGSPASGRIPPAIVDTILYTLVYGLDPWTALAKPRVYPFVNSPVVQVEQGIGANALAGLRKHGYRIEVHPPDDLYFGGVHVVLVRDDGTLIGAADPRRDGAAVGY